MSSVDEEFEPSVDEDEEEEEEEYEVPGEHIAIRLAAVFVGLILIGLGLSLYYVFHLDHDGFISFIIGIAGGCCLAKGLRVNLPFI